jgi:hypothetical protein
MVCFDSSTLAIHGKTDRLRAGLATTHANKLRYLDDEHQG